MGNCTPKPLLCWRIQDIYPATLQTLSSGLPPSRTWQFAIAASLVALVPVNAWAQGELNFRAVQEVPATLAQAATPVDLSRASSEATRTVAAVRAPEPATAAEPGAFRLGITGWFGSSLGSGFAVDTSRYAPATSTLDARWRARLELDTAEVPDHWHFLGAVGVDVVDGAAAGRNLAAGDRLPDSRWQTVLFQEAWLGAQYGKLAGVRAGLMTSHWGLGLVANDGGNGHSLERNDWFTPSRSGDRVMRVAVSFMPLIDTASVARGLWLTLAADAVIDDENARWIDGDRAMQIVGAGRLYLAKEQWLGLYAVHRSQRTSGGADLAVNVVDAALDLDQRVQGHGLRTQGEAVYIGGTTSLSPTPDFPTHRLQQAAAAGRLTWRSRGDLEAQLDLGWFRGDADLDDGTMTTFHADRNFRQGLVLFPRVLAWQTGTARLRASDLNLVGVPQADLDRLASDGAVFNAITIFPKVGWHLTDAGELYAGALLAWAPAPPTDPYTSRTATGGQPSTPYGLSPDGHYLGSEVDVGARWRLALPQGFKTLVQISAEGAILLPGGALSGSGAAPGHVAAGLLRVGLIGR